MKGLRSGDLVWVTTSGGTMQDVYVQKESVSFLRILVTLFVVAAGNAGDDRHPSSEVVLAVIHSTMVGKIAADDTP